MSLPVVTLAGEGIVDIAILRRLARDAKMQPGAEYGRKGKDHLDRRIAGYNEAAQFVPWAVVRDLDADESCAGALVNALLPKPKALMCFRIVIRSAEAWLLSDSVAFCREFFVSARHVPDFPESVLNPKAAMLDALAGSTSREIRDAMVRVVRGGSRAIGPEYNARLSAFAEGQWRPTEAARIAQSLARARLRMRQLQARCSV